MTQRTPRPNKFELLELKMDANEAIGLTTNLKLDEAINWGDLRCVEASYILTDEGDARWRVLIEEAAPDAQKFCELIRAALELRGWSPIEVVTEW